MDLKTSAANQSSTTLEEKIGTRIFVWAGAIALAWAGGVLVKYSFEHGLISPPLRIAMGILLGIVFLSAGEWLRNSTARISQGFSAAGIADLYVSLLAAHHLYHLIEPITAFFFLALITSTAVLLSLRQGPLIALLGLCGGFLTPVWISASQPDIPFLFAYLFLLQTGLLVVAKKRGWWPLILLTFVGQSVWALAWIGLLFDSKDAACLGNYIVGWLFSFLLFSRFGSNQNAWGNAIRTFHLNWIAALNALIQVTSLTVAWQHAFSGWLYCAITAIALLLLCRKSHSYQFLCWIASGAMAVLLFDGSGMSHFLSIALALGFLWSAGAYFILWKSEKPSHFATLSVCSSIGYFLTACIGEKINSGNLHWGIVSMILAAAYVAGVAPIARRREAFNDGSRIVAILAVGATTFLSLSIPLELEKEWIAVAWSVESMALLWIAFKLRLQSLRTISLALGSFVIIRLAVPAGLNLTWNWILYAYGIPLLAFLQAARLSRRDQQFNLSRIFESFSLMLVFILVTLEVWQFSNSGVNHRGFLSERSAYSSCWLLLALVFFHVSAKWNSRVAETGGLAILVLALFHIIGGHLFYYNPLIFHRPVGTTIVWNQLIPLYAIPAVLLGFVSRNRRRKESLLLFLNLLILLLSFIFLNLEIRQFFHGTYLDADFTTTLENYMYSVAMILFAGALTVVGLLTRGIVSRYCSMALMLAAIGKVFLFDTENLTDLYRFLSLLGLGLSLLFTAFLYQKFLLKRTV